MPVCTHDKIKCKPEPIALENNIPNFNFVIRWKVST